MISASRLLEAQLFKYFEVSIQLPCPSHFRQVQELYFRETLHDDTLTCNK
jgi:hypothetical protein